MKASITNEGKLVLYFNEGDRRELKIELGSHLAVRREESKLYLLVPPGDMTPEGPYCTRIATIIDVPKSPNVQARFSLEQLGMKELPTRKSREVPYALEPSPCTTLPEIFFSTVPDDHGAKVVGMKKSTFNGGSPESRLRLAISTINEAVAKGDAKLKVDRNTGKLVVKAYVTMGG